MDRRYRKTVSRLGQLCFTGGRDTLAAAAAIASQLFAPIFTDTALSGPFAELLRANSPQELVQAPLLVAQGGADQLVLPTMQRQWVTGRCAAGQQLDFRTYPGLDHLSLVAADSPLTPPPWSPGPWSAWPANPRTTPAESPDLKRPVGAIRRLTKEYGSSWIFEPCLTCANALRRVQRSAFSLVA